MRQDCRAAWRQRQPDGRQRSVACLLGFLAGMAPDLRGSPILASAEAFAEVVRNGSRQVNGMPVFEHLSDEQLLAIRHYVRREAERALPE